MTQLESLTNATYEMLNEQKAIQFLVKTLKLHYIQQTCIN